MVLVVTFYNVIIGQKKSSLFNNSNGVFFSIHLNCNGIWAEGAVKGRSELKKKNAAVKKACTYTLE